MNTPTKEDIEYFYERVVYHQCRLNLLNWRIEVKRQPSKKKLYAEVGMSWEDRLALITLGGDWGDLEVNKYTLDDVALHEVLHVFLKTYQVACSSRKDPIINSEEHALIAVLERLLHEDPCPT